MPIVSWIKQNKLSAFLILLLVVLFLTKTKTNPVFNARSMISSTVGVAPEMGFAQSEGVAMMKSMPVSPDYAPQADVSERLVIQNSNLSLQVKDVGKTRDDIVVYAQTNGGYMVVSNTENPEESPTGNVTIRVPSDKLSDTLAFLRGLAIKVVSENLQGFDVTDQYVDVEKRIAILEKTLAKFESILASATEISDITNLNREIINVQSEIDSFKGQQEALAKNAELAKISIYLATDEIALPYAPTETWRPNVIFKLAVRSMVSDIRGIGTKFIWLAVYAVFWVPALVILLVVYKFFSKKR